MSNPQNLGTQHFFGKGTPSMFIQNTLPFFQEKLIATY